MNRRHRWGERVVFPHKTERECARCGMIRVSRHEVDGPRDVHWTEFWMNGDQLSIDATPKCEPRNL